MLGNVIKRLREDRQWSQVKLAHKAGVSSDYISRIELGKKQNVGSAKLKRIAAALGVTMRDLYLIEEVFVSGKPSIEGPKTAHG